MSLTSLKLMPMTPRRFTVNFPVDTPDDVADSILKDLPRRTERFIAFPIWVNDNHWAVALVDQEEGLIEYYESLNYSTTTKTMARNLTRVAESLSGSLNKQYVYKQMITEPVQTGGVDCGVWILYFIEERIKGNTPTMAHWKQSSIRDYRRKLQTRLEELEVHLSPRGYFIFHPDPKSVD